MKFIIFGIIWLLLILQYSTSLSSIPLKSSPISTLNTIATSIKSRDFNHDQIDQHINFKVINSAVLDFAPWLELHHIVLLHHHSDPSLVCAIDFSPLDQTSPNTLNKLLSGNSVPAEIRVNWVSDFDGNIESVKKIATDSLKLSKTAVQRYKNPPSYAANDLIEFVDSIKNQWSINMNFYTHNCQHFSGFVRSLVKKRTNDKYRMFT